MIYYIDVVWCILSAQVRGSIYCVCGVCVYVTAPSFYTLIIMIFKLFIYNVYIRNCIITVPILMLLDKANGKWKHYTMKPIMNDTA